MEDTSLTLNDLMIIINIIDACSERGSFKGNELLTVGQIRDKLNKIVSSTQSPEKSDEKDSEV